MAEATLAPVRRVAGYDLPPDSGRGPGFAVAATDATAFVRVLARQQLSGIALAASDSGWLELPAPEESVLVDRHRAAMMWALDLERTLLRLSDRFDAAGVKIVVLKGPAIANAVYPDPSWRPFGDLDVLVRTVDWKHACEILREAGFVRDLPEPRRGFDERFGKAASHSDDVGRQVDLHRTLVLGPYGLLMDPDELFGRTSEFRLGGRMLRRLDDTAALVNACLHAALGAWPPLPMPLRDVAQVAWSGRVDWEALVVLAERWRVLPVVAHSLRTAAQWLASELPAAAQPIAAMRPSAADRRLLGAYTRSRRRGGMALANIPRIPGMRARAAYVRAMLVPDPAFLAARSRNDRRPSYLRRWGVPVRWLFSRKEGGR